MRIFKYFSHFGFGYCFKFGTDELGLSFEKRDFGEMSILIHNYVGKIIAMANTGHGSTNVTSVQTVAEYIY